MKHFRTLERVAWRRWFSGPILLVVVLSGLAGCNPKKPEVAPAGSGTNAPAQSSASPDFAAPDPCRMILLPVSGHSPLDRQIAATQQAVRRGGSRADEMLEHLGWLFVSKARVSFDPGYYKLAEQAAFCLENRHPHSPEALLLRGHVLDNLHQFKQAEPLARELVARRGLSVDYGLLGDVLMEQGRLDEAVGAYQHMTDLKPDIHAYTRAAHVRWLKGDLVGATAAMQMAVQATTPRDPETAAWVYTRMALYQLQAGRIESGLAHCAVALQFQTNYAPALLAKGRLLLASGRDKEAIQCLRAAEKVNPLPEYEWTLLDALHSAGAGDEAVEKDLRERGAMTDPRTYALYLATRRQDPAKAVDLAKAELETRQDVFTHDALAWALFADGRIREAGAEMEMALLEGTQDGRLFFHAGMIKEKLGRRADALRFFAKARELQPMLLPSERAELAGQCSKLAMNSAAAAKPATP